METNELKEWVEKHDNKLEKIDDRISGIDIQLAVVEQQREEHNQQQATTTESIKRLYDLIEKLTKRPMQWINNIGGIVGAISGTIGLLLALRVISQVVK